MTNKAFVKLLFIPTILLVVVVCTLFLEPHTVKAGNGDPDPRIEYLGSEVIAQPNITGQPYRVHFYKDRVTHNEIECWAGQLRDTLSCFQTGRLR